MHTLDDRKALVSLVSACLLSACASAPVKVPTVAELQRQAHGGWISLRNQDSVEVKGELIAIDDWRLHVLTHCGLVALTSDDVIWAELWSHKPESSVLAAWAGLGAASTLSHGQFLLLTGPLWIIGGTVASINEASSGRLDYPKTSWEHFRKYARFPQGLPPGLDQRALTLPCGYGVKMHREDH